MHNTQTLYQCAGIPAMQNKLYLNKAKALKAPLASLELVQDESGLVFNRCLGVAILQIVKNAVKCVFGCND